MIKLFYHDYPTRLPLSYGNTAGRARPLPRTFSCATAPKAFAASFTEAVREATKETGVTITILKPGVTNTDFFNKAGMERAKLGAEGPKADPAQVAQDGYEALLTGKDKIISGLLHKAQAVLGHVLPDSTVAAIMHKQAEPVDGIESTS